MAALAFGFIAAAAVPAKYAAIAFSVASTIGGSLFAPRPPSSHLSAPRLESLQFPSIPFGNFIPYMDGSDRLSPDILWFSEIRAIPHVQSQTVSSGGFLGIGKKKSTSTYTTYTYEVDLLFALAHHGDGDLPVGIAKFWHNGKLMYNISSDASESTLSASYYSTKWSRLSFYDGNASQLPDPDYESAVIDAPAYRGLSTVFIKNFKLGDSNQLGNFQFELMRHATKSQAAGSFLDIGDRSIGDGGSPIEFNPQNYHCIDANEGWVWTSATDYNFDLYHVKAIDKSGAIKYQHTFDISGGSPQYHAGMCASATHIYLGYYNTLQLKIIKIDLRDLNNVSGDQYTYHSYSVLNASWLRFDTKQNRLLAGDGWSVGAGATVRIIDPETMAVVTSINYGSGTIDIQAFKWYSWFESSSNHFVITNNTHTVICNNVGTPSIQHTLTIGGQWVIYDQTADRFIVGGGSAGTNNTVYSINPTSGAYTSHVVSLPVDAGPNEGANFDMAAIDKQTGNYILIGKGITYTTMCTVDPSFVALSSHYYNTTAESAIYHASANDKFVIGFNNDDILKLDFANDSYIPTPQTVKACVDRIAEYCKIDPSNYDTTALSSITKLVHGFHSTDATSGRAMLEQLMISHNFGAYRADKIYFVPLASSPVRTFDYDELGAGLDKAEDNPFALQQNTDIERGARYSITYPCLSNAYNTDTRSTDRRVTAVNNTIDSRDLAVVMTPEQAQGVADTLSLSTQAGRYSASVSVFGEHDDITPLDVLTFTDNAGRTHRMRAMSVTHSWPIVKMSLVMDDANAIRETGVTDDSFVLDESVIMAADTVLELADIPLIADVFEGSGISYMMAAYGTTSEWGGCLVMQSPNNNSFSPVESIGEVGIIGETLGTLAAGVDDGALDITSVVYVSLSKGASSSDYDDVINDRTEGLWLIGDELVQVCDCVLTEFNSYRLSKMLRGRFGTEWAMGTHSAGERVIKITSSGVRFSDIPVGKLGQTMYYKGVSAGQLDTDVSSEIFINNGESKKPLSPVHPYATKSGNDIVLTWQRRTRLEHRLIGGLYLPLGEDSESYSIDIYDGVNIVRTITTTSPTLTYTDAQQTADFGGLQTSVHVKIYQLSAMVGRGRPLDYQSGVL